MGAGSTKYDCPSVGRKSEGGSWKLEVGINDYTIKHIDEYVIMISELVKKKQFVPSLRNFVFN